MPDGGPELFFTLQGEGRGVGRPSIFIRASLCNLHCRWCDTDYTWNWDDTTFPHERDADPSYQKHRRSEQIIDLDIEAITTAAARFPCRSFVFTAANRSSRKPRGSADGGPRRRRRGTRLVRSRDQRNPPSRAGLSRTNRPGQRLPETRQLGRAGAGTAQAGVLSALAASGKADFKFVIGDENDLAEVLELVSLSGIAAERVFPHAEGAHRRRTRGRPGCRRRDRPRPRIPLLRPAPPPALRAKRGV